MHTLHQIHNPEGVQVNAVYLLLIIDYNSK